jgi:hypothetical protein
VGGSEKEGERVGMQKGWGEVYIRTSMRPGRSNAGSMSFAGEMTGGGEGKRYMEGSRRWMRSGRAGERDRGCMHLHAPGSKHCGVDEVRVYAWGRSERDREGGEREEVRGRVGRREGGGVVMQGRAYLHLHAPRSQQRRVDELGPVCHSYDQDVVEGLDAVHLG